MQASIARGQPRAQRRRHVLHEGLGPAVDRDTRGKLAVNGIAQFEDPRHFEAWYPARDSNPNLNVRSVLS